MELMHSLLEAQNPDGGWPYYRGALSWTEPTAYALLAMTTASGTESAMERGLAWLRAAQRADGAWLPQRAVAESTWVTAVATLLGPAKLGANSYWRGIAWLLGQTGEESSTLSRLRGLIMGYSPPADGRFPGWPWLPGTSAWVTPTALAMLALRKAVQFRPDGEIRRRLEMGRSFLLAHVCSDGGWNYGCTRAMGYDAPSYPETTGVALLALHGVEVPQVRRACDWACAQWETCRISEAQSWLRLGLLAHGRLRPDEAPPCQQRSIQNAALALLAAAAEQGRNVFLE
jgi:hypothetical protein